MISTLFSSKKQMGFTLIEVIIFLVLAGILLPLMFIPVVTSLKNYSTPIVISTAAFLGEELMEEIISKVFDDPADTALTLPANLGPEAGETRTAWNNTTYNDVDDYHGLSETPPGTEFASYTRSAIVFYVDPSGDLDTNAGTTTSLKRIQVTVTHADIPNLVHVTFAAQ